jgi:hypothetical protein
MTNDYFIRPEKWSIHGLKLVIEIRRKLSDCCFADKLLYASHFIFCLVIIACLKMAWQVQHIFPARTSPKGKYSTTLLPFIATETHIINSHWV